VVGQEGLPTASRSTTSSGGVHQVIERTEMAATFKKSNSPDQIDQQTLNFGPRALDQRRDERGVEELRVVLRIATHPYMILWPKGK